MMASLCGPKWYQDHVARYFVREVHLAEQSGAATDRDSNPADQAPAKI